MPNKNWNDQSTEGSEAGKSPQRRGQNKPLTRPGYDQVKSTKPAQKSLGQKFQGKSEMVDKLD